MPNKEDLKPLLKLLDDPDIEIYNVVSEKLLQYGKTIIPSLEILWESTNNDDLQDRISHLIHNIYFNNVKSELLKWVKTPNPDLIQGVLIVTRHHYPSLNEEQIKTSFEEIKKNIWLELNHYLSPIEKINAFNSIIYNHHKLTGEEINERKIDNFYLNRLFQHKKGNIYSLGILYITLASHLDLPIFAINIPHQFILFYDDTVMPYINVNTQIQKIKPFGYYIDPLNGLLYTQKDLEYYLSKLNLDPSLPQWFKNLNEVEILSLYLTELKRNYMRIANSEETVSELQELLKILQANTTIKE